MIHWFMRRRIAAFESRFDYDMSYAREMLEASPRALFELGRLGQVKAGAEKLRGDLPLEALVAAQLVATAFEDCGPCTQLGARMAAERGISPDVVRAAIAGDASEVSPDVATAIRFARASLERAPEADELRRQLAQRFGKRGVVALALTMAAARTFPTLKYALGHGHACRRVLVDGREVRALGAPA